MSVSVVIETITAREDPQGPLADDIRGALEALAKQSVQPDEVLVVRFQSGDRAAFAMLVRRHQSGLYNFALRNLRERTAAEDIVQEAFVRVAQSAADFKADARFSTWVYTIARNLCHDQGRRMKFRRHASLDEPLSKEHDGAARVEFVQDPGPTPHAGCRPPPNTRRRPGWRCADPGLSDPTPLG